MDDAITARLNALAEQHRAGMLTEAEYAAAKRAVLDGGAGADPGQETLMLPAVDTPDPAPRPQRSLLPLIVGAVVVAVLAAVVLLGPTR
jgi:hypothetical protein